MKNKCVRESVFACVRACVVVQKNLCNICIYECVYVSRALLVHVVYMCMRVSVCVRNCGSGGGREIYTH